MTTRITGTEAQGLKRSVRRSEQASDTKSARRYLGNAISITSNDDESNENSNNLTEIQGETCAAASRLATRRVRGRSAPPRRRRRPPPRPGYNQYNHL